ncbi:hypothetical protein NBRC116593_37640 [Sulfitobacter pacificus]
MKSGYACRVSTGAERIRSDQLIHLVNREPRVVQGGKNDWCCDFFNGKPRKCPVSWDNRTTPR